MLDGDELGWLDGIDDGCDDGMLDGDELGWLDGFDDG